MSVRLCEFFPEFSKGLILPKTGDDQPNNITTPRQNFMGPNLDTPAARSSPSPIGCRIYTAQITLTDTFMAPVEELYDCLTVQQASRIVRCLLNYHYTPIFIVS